MQDHPITNTEPGIAWDTLIERMQAYLRFDTSNPPGPANRPDAPHIDWLVATYLEPLGIPYEIADKHLLIARFPAHLGRRPADREAILLMSHADVVPVPDEEWPRWHHPPFGGVVDDGYVWGRGAIDMKSTTIMQLEALADLWRRGVALPRDYLVTVVPDEEVGGLWGGRKLASEHYESLGAIAAVLDEGGFMIDNFVDGVKVAAIGMTEKSEARLRLVARGAAGHASVPVERDAVRDLIAALQILLNRPPRRRLHPVLARGLRAIGREASAATQAITSDYLVTRPLLLAFLARNPLTDALTRTTVTVTELAAGKGQNVRPGEAAAVLNARILPDETADEVVARFRRLLDGLGVDVEILDAEDPVPAAPRDTFEYRQLTRVLRHEHPGIAVATMVCPGATDSRFLARLGVPVYRFIPIEMSREDPPNFHAANERISVDNLIRGTTLYEQLFVNW